MRAGAKEAGAGGIQSSHGGDSTGGRDVAPIGTGWGGARRMQVWESVWG